jgi:hypothetical protein
MSQAAAKKEIAGLSILVMLDLSYDVSKCIHRLGDLGFWGMTIFIRCLQVLLVGKGTLVG